MDFWEALSMVAGLVVGFTWLVFVHELGHYLLAKWNGVRVSVFSIGMGPYIASFTNGETVYVLSLVPIGGYVKMAGQDDMRPNLASSKDPHDYRNKHPGQRAAILAAGAAFNLLFALVAFTFCYYLGVEVSSARVGEVAPDSPLAQAQVLEGKDEYRTMPLQKGDKITAIDGVPVRSLLDVTLQIACTGVDKVVQIDYERKDQPAQAPVFVTTKRNKSMGAAHIGMEQYLQARNFQVGFRVERALFVRGVRAGSAAEAAGVKKEDVILEVDGRPVHTYLDIISKVQAAKGSEQKVHYRRGEEKLEAKLKAVWDEKEDKFLLGLEFLPSAVAEIDAGCEAYAQGLRKGHYIGDVRELRDGKTLELTRVIFDGAQKTRITMRIPKTSNSGSALIYEEELPEITEIKFDSFMDALSVAFGDVVRHSYAVFAVIKGLFTRDIGLPAISGPIGIATVMTKVSVQHTFMYYIWFLGFLSVNLGVLQFVPIPLLDGWHLLLIGVEKLKGSPVAPKIQEAFQYVGLLIILTIFILATKNDLTRWFF